MTNYKPVDGHWQSRMEAIEGRPRAELEQPKCAQCGEELEPEMVEALLDYCERCLRLEQNSSDAGGGVDLRGAMR